MLQYYYRVILNGTPSKVKRALKYLTQNQNIKNKYKDILQTLENTTKPRDINPRTYKTGKHLYYIRGAYGRYLVRQAKNNTLIKILGIVNCSNDKNRVYFANLTNKFYDKNININTY